MACRGGGGDAVHPNYSGPLPGRARGPSGPPGRARRWPGLPVHLIHRRLARPQNNASAPAKMPGGAAGQSCCPTAGGKQRGQAIAWPFRWASSCWMVEAWSVVTMSKVWPLDIAVAQHNGHAAGLRFTRKGFFVAGGVHNQAVHPAREQKRNLIPLFGPGHHRNLQTRAYSVLRSASPTPSKTAVENGEDWSETQYPAAASACFSNCAQWCWAGSPIRQ